MIRTILLITLIITMAGCHTARNNPSPNKKEKLTGYVNNFLGTAPLQDSIDCGYNPPKDWRVWAGLTYPGASLPNAMVQLSPITEWHSGAGYEYEDDVILAFTHTNKGHWNLCHIPVLPVTEGFSENDFGSKFSHENESAEPGYYQVKLDRYGIDAELTSTLHCGYHKYEFPKGKPQNIIVNLSKSNERVRDWHIEQEGTNVIKGFQQTGEKIYFYAETNRTIVNLETSGDARREIALVSFNESDEELELKLALSFVSIENAKQNLEAELAGKSFEEVKNEASETWENLLSKIKVEGGTDKQKSLFYSSLYRSFLWPALRSDVNGEFTDASGEVVNKGFRYYTNPSLWDTYRNKLVLLGMLSPDVTADVIQSLIDKGEKTGFMPTFFHGDHAAPFISGSYLRGIRDYDVQSAYQLLLNNATKEGGTRPHIAEYIEKGYISTPEVENPHVESKAKAGVTKTLEFAYDDYAVALLAEELGKQDDYKMLMKRTSNYKNLFDPSTGLMRGKLENGDWVPDFNAEYPYYEYMYREANAWQSSFFAPHDTKGLIGLYKSEAEFEEKLDSLFSIPWNADYIARNVSSFIGQYCHGNQPDHSFPYLYTFIGKQEKSQMYLDSIMNRFYGMGEWENAFCGMDDAGEMSAWYVFAAMGIYPYSPGDAEYIVSVPLFNSVKLDLGEQSEFKISKTNSGRKIKDLTIDGNLVEGYFVSHEQLKKGKELIILTE
ncbi:alpha-1,2-mannosidase, putative [Draconibacterium orientale]|uniref:Alpha-1,2-mannosidase, putative n=1 Tax=Draconibacterium orientale TaxID=1168034 RepID=X5DYI4_9BACT|nr:GH92 family glycosyl hydrolase [Draconibacterium orientale]AHW60280.1 alpha-mannosidase [Draconibacterium orientale]SET67569.1 alpha-1,2-mannosidase, putative [Draconibacterium orientale]